MALRTTCAEGLYVLMSKPAFWGNRAHIGGHDEVDCPASCRAGQRCDCCVHCAVNLMACPISPGLTSSYRTRPGRIASPAASALVQPFGRSAFEARLQIAPLPAVGLPLFQWASKSS